MEATKTNLKKFKGRSLKDSPYMHYKTRAMIEDLNPLNISTVSASLVLMGTTALHLMGVTQHFYPYGLAGFDFLNAVFAALFFLVIVPLVKLGIIPTAITEHRSLELVVVEFFRWFILSSVKRIMAAYLLIFGITSVAGFGNHFLIKPTANLIRLNIVKAELLTGLGTVTPYVVRIQLLIYGLFLVWIFFFPGKTPAGTISSWKFARLVKEGTVINRPFKNEEFTVHSEMPEHIANWNAPKRRMSEAQVKTPKQSKKKDLETDYTKTDQINSEVKRRRRKAPRLPE